MGQKTIQPTRLSGRVKVPPSKSMAHRAIICAALAEGRSIVENVAFSDDILATMEGMRRLGARIEDLGGGRWLSTASGRDRRYVACRR